MEAKYNMIQLVTSLVMMGPCLIMGLMINSFIVAVNFMNWLTGRPASSIDQIITTLAISRIVFHSICVVDLLFFFYDLFFPTVQMFFDFTEMSAIYCNIWLLSLLLVTVCLKISNLHNAFILHLRAIIDRWTVSLIITSVFLCHSNAAILIWSPHDVQYKNSTSYLLLNDSQSDQKSKIYAAMFVYGNIFPFLLSFISSVIIITSLCHHLVRMKRSNNLTTHLGPIYEAIEAVITSFFSFVLQISTVAITLYFDLSLGPLWFYAIWNFLPILHSGYIIYKTSKLKRKFLEMLDMGTTCICSSI